jgi:adenosylcobinamide-phosphate synthase
MRTGVADCRRLAACIERLTMLSGLSVPVAAILMVMGVLLDLLLGEVPCWHPLVGFGRYASYLERRLNRQTHNFALGVFAWLCAVLPVVLLFAGLIVWIDMPILAAVLHIFLLYFSLGLRSLRDHSLPIARALGSGDLAEARLLTARIVSRDTQQSEEADLSKAAVESLLENGNDAVFGTLFWFVIAGGPGALLFRLANTLDAMWGYRTLRFHAFGCGAARLDDVLNWIPARLTALSYTLLGNRRLAWQCWHVQAKQWPSPNAGPVMAAGAGALQVQLGGEASYDGVVEQRPSLGSGRDAGAADILRAWRLVLATTIWWCAVMAMIGAIIWWRN